MTIYKKSSINNIIYIGWARKQLSKLIYLDQQAQARDTSYRLYHMHYSLHPLLNPQAAHTHNPDKPLYRTTRRKPKPPLTALQPSLGSSSRPRTGSLPLHPKDSLYLQSCHPHPRHHSVRPMARLMVRKQAGQTATRIDPGTELPSYPPI